MGQGMSGQKCSGCEKTTPFFGEIYGRMSENAHGATNSGMGHHIVGDVEDDNHKTQYSEFNKFKNKLLIPFYGTVLAVRVLESSPNSCVNSLPLYQCIV